MGSRIAHGRDRLFFGTNYRLHRFVQPVSAIARTASSAVAGSGTASVSLYTIPPVPLAAVLVTMAYSSPLESCPKPCTVRLLGSTGMTVLSGKVSESNCDEMNDLIWPVVRSA